MGINMTNDAPKPFQSKLIQFFKYDHLPVNLQAISGPFGDLATRMDDALPNNPEKSTCLRKLLEAKDCAVRALLYKE